LFLAESLLLFSHPFEVKIAKISLSFSLEEVSQKLLIIINELIDLLRWLKEFVRELAVVIAFVTLASCMQILAGIVSKVVRESTSCSTVTAACQEKLAKFFRLLVNGLLGSIRLEPFCSLFDCVELILASTSSHLVAAISAPKIIEGLSTTHVTSSSHEAA
jgi:hypothetical protein